MIFVLVAGLATTGCESGDDQDVKVTPPVCNPVTGLAQPLSTCSSEDPCVQLSGALITTSTEIPTCESSDPEQPFFSDGPPIEWNDVNSIPRYACIFRPEGTSAESRRSLVLWLHGGEGSADRIYDRTSLRQKAESFDLSGDPSRPGFILVSIQGRNVHYLPGDPLGSSKGSYLKHDFYFRDLKTNTKNPDFQFYDHLIDSLVSEGIVDPQRIYIMGVSNGGFMAQAYAIARLITSTPGGNHVAAAVSVAAADPFHNTSADQVPSCQLDPYPQSDVPILLIHRSCDAFVACSPSQQTRFATPPGFNLLDWLDALTLKIGNSHVGYQIIDSEGDPTNSCDDTTFCTEFIGLANHIRWPDGVSDGGGKDWEPTMLQFLKDNPHP